MAQKTRKTARSAAKKTTPTALGGRIPASTREEERKDFNPFLRATDIGDLDSTAQLELTGVARVVDGNFGEQIIAEVRYQRKLYDWPIKIDSPNHRRLEDAVGLDTRRWKGRRVSVTIKNNMGRDYIAVDRPE